MTLPIFLLYGVAACVIGFVCGLIVATQRATPPRLVEATAHYEAVDETGKLWRVRISSPEIAEAAYVIEARSAQLAVLQAQARFGEYVDESNAIRKKLRLGGSPLQIAWQDPEPESE